MISACFLLAFGDKVLKDARKKSKKNKRKKRRRKRVTVKRKVKVKGLKDIQKMLKNAFKVG